MNTIFMLQSSLSIILENWYLLLCLLIVQGAFATLTAWLMSDILLDKESLSILSFLGGILGFTLFSLFIAFLRVKPSFFLGITINATSFFVLILCRRHLRILILPNLVWLTIFFLLIFLLRLIFIRDLLVPPYFDSIEHLKIVKDFLNPDLPPQAFYRLSFDLSHYYHFGFHALAAFLSSITSTTPENTILLLGQYYQALAVLAIYPLARILTKDTLSAWIVMIIPGFFLSIPAYTSNWGKYPAIASLCGIVFEIVLLLIYARSELVFSRKILWLTGCVVISTTCLHSRSFFVFLLVGFSVILHTRFNFIFEKLKVSNCYAKTRVLVAILWAVMLYILILALEFPSIPFLYFFIFLFLILSILAFYSNFMLAWALITFMIVMGFTSFFSLPLPFLPFRYTMLFDRPYLIIFFYLPISFLVWQGLEGGLCLLTEHGCCFSRSYLLVGMLFWGLVNVVFIQNHQSSECCILLDDNDFFSFHWMRKNLPKNALVGIAAIGGPENLTPVDGGAWIESSTGISTRKLNLFNNDIAMRNFDFVSAGVNLCKEGITHFYVDGVFNSFDEYYLTKIDVRYQFGIGNVSIYSLDCDILP